MTLRRLLDTPPLLNANPVAFREVAASAVETSTSPIATPVLDPSQAVSIANPGIGPIVSPGSEGLTLDVVVSLVNDALAPYATISYVIDQVALLQAQITDLATDFTLDELIDVTITTPTSGQYLKWNGSGWINSTIDYSEVTGTPGSGTFVDLVSAQTIGGHKNFTGTHTVNGNDVWHAGNDGSGSTLDADLLDGQHGAYYLPAGSYTAADVLAKLLTVDGVGSGIDADLLGGVVQSNYTRNGAVQTFSGIKTFNVTIPITYTTNALPSLSIKAMNTLSYGPTTTDFLIGRNVYYDATGALYKAFATDTVGWGLLRIASNAIEFAGATGSTTAGGTITPTFNTVWHAGNDGAASGLDADLLDGLDSTAFLLSSSYTAADVLSKLLTVDGSGSGLDADLLDGLSSAAFGKLASNQSWSGTNTHTAPIVINYSPNATPAFVLQSGFGVLSTVGAGRVVLGRNVYYDETNATYKVYGTSAAGWAFIEAGAGNGPRFSSASGSVTAGDVLSPTFNTIWHAGNDGSASGLDADLLDGLNSTAFGQLASAQTWSNTNTFSGQVISSYTPNAAPNFRWGTLAMLSYDASANAILARNAYYDVTATAYKIFGNSAAGWGMLEVSSAGARVALATGTVTAGTTITPTWGTVWTSVNDGSGSGLDADLVRGTTPSAFILTLLDDANAATALSTLGALASSSYTAADVLAKLITVDGSGSGLDADLLRGVTPGAFGLTLIDDTTQGAAQTTLGLVPGTNVQAYNAALASIAGLTTAANKGIYATASNTYATYDLSAFALTLLDDTSAAAMLSTLGALGSGTYTASDVLSKLLTVDGSGSGLDADLLDGISSAAFGQLASNQTWSGTNTFSSNIAFGTALVSTPDTYSSWGAGFRTISWNSPDLDSFKTSGAGSLIHVAPSSIRGYQLGVSHDGSMIRYRSIHTSFGTGFSSWFTIWSEATDGSGSGLDADIIRGTTPGTFGLSLLDDTTQAAARTTLALTPGTDVQAFSAALASIAGLTTAADRGIYTTASNTYAVYTFTSFARTLLDDADATTARSTLGLGTAATQNTGTSGANIPLLNASNTWSASQAFSGFTVSNFFSALGAGGTGSYWGQGLYFNTEWRNTATGSYGYAFRNNGASGLQIVMSTGAGTQDTLATTVNVTLAAVAGAIWTSGNDGSGSGLDADLLRGTTPSAYGLTLIDDADAATARTTLGLGTAAVLNTGTSGGTIPLLNGTNTWSGPQTIDVTGGVSFLILGNNNAQSAFLYLQNAAGQNRGISIRTGSSPRYLLGANAVAEGGSNAGSNFFFDAYDDSGVSLGSVFTVTRSTRLVNFAVNPTSNGSTIWNAANDGSGSGLDADMLRGTTPSAYGLTLIDDADAATARTTLGLGTAATQNTGTSGGNIPLLNAANTFSANTIFANGSSATVLSVGSAVAFDATFAIRANAGQNRILYWQTGTSRRFAMYAETTAESGSNAGSNFIFRAYDDAAASLGDVFSVVRSTRVVTFAVAPAFTDASTTRTNLGLAIGTNVQAYNAALASIAGLTTAADKGIYTTASNTYATYDLSSFARTILDDTSASAVRTTLGLGTSATVNTGTSGTTIPLLDGTNTWSGVNTFSSSITARVTLVTAVSGTLTTTHANVSCELNGNVTLPNSVFTAGDKTVFDPGTSARTFTRGSGIAMYLNGTDVASATLGANQIGGVHWRTTSIAILTGAFT